MRTLMANMLLVLLGLTAGAAALHTLPPLATEMTYEDRRIERKRPTCEVLFIGPSYVKAQIIEPVFDAEAKRIGAPMRSCKVGGTGVSGIELQVHLARLLQRSWPKLRFVVIDITLGAKPRIDRVNWYKARFIQWHTLDSASWILRYYERHPREASVSQTLAHLGHLAANYGNLGVGIELFANLHLVTRVRAFMGEKVRVPIPVIEQKYERDLRGWERRKKAQAHTGLSPAALRKHERRVASLARDKRAARARGDRRDDAWPQELRALVEERGAEAIFIKAPVWRLIAPAASQRTRPLVIMDFNDPERYPVLYEPKNRGRTHHLSWYGGVEYSKLLARKIAKQRNEKRP